MVSSDLHALTVRLDVLRDIMIVAMAEPIVTAVLPEIHRVFQSYLVREGLSYFACKHLECSLV